MLRNSQQKRCSSALPSNRKKVLLEKLVAAGRVHIQSMHLNPQETKDAVESLRSTLDGYLTSNISVSARELAQLARTAGIAAKAPLQQKEKGVTAKKDTLREEPQKDATQKAEGSLKEEIHRWDQEQSKAHALFETSPRARQDVSLARALSRIVESATPTRAGSSIREALHFSKVSCLPEDKLSLVDQRELEKKKMAEQRKDLDSQVQARKIEQEKARRQWMDEGRAIDEDARLYWSEEQKRKFLEKQRLRQECETALNVLNDRKKAKDRQTVEEQRSEREEIESLKRDRARKVEAEAAKKNDALDKWKSCLDENSQELSLQRQKLRQERVQDAYYTLLAEKTEKEVEEEREHLRKERLHKAQQQQNLAEKMINKIPVNQRREVDLARRCATSLCMDEDRREGCSPSRALSSAEYRTELEHQIRRNQEKERACLLEQSRFDRQVKHNIQAAAVRDAWKRADAARRKRELQNFHILQMQAKAAIQSQPLITSIARSPPL